MAPVFSRVRAGVLALPMETWLVIMESSTLSDKRALMLTCKILHDMLAPILYRVLVTQERVKPRPVKAIRSSRVPTTAILPCLLLSTQNVSGRGTHHRYADYIKSFTILSYIPLSNLRAIPILVQILRHMPSLRFLRIEVCDESLPLLVALLCRSNLVRMPTLEYVVDTSTVSSPHTILYLPALRGFRTNHHEVAACMLHLRPLEMLVVDAPACSSGLPRFLHEITSAGSSLTSLSLALAGSPDTLDFVVQTVMLSLPVLEYLSFRTDPEILFPLMTVALDILKDYPRTLATIRCLGINQGELSRDGKDLSTLHHRLVEVSERRYRFVMVIMGTARWARKDEYSNWRFTEFCFDYGWPWLFRSG